MKHRFDRLHGTRRTWKGAVAGVIAGAAATVFMTQFQNAWNWASDQLKSERDQEGGSQGPSQSDEPSTDKVAGAVASLAGHELSQNQKKKGGALVHYGFGTTAGTVYGLTMELTPRHIRPPAPIAGLGFGTALFLAADEVLVPALKLSKKPSQQPVGSHLYGLVSHLVYGVALEGARAAIRSFL